LYCLMPNFTFFAAQNENCYIHIIIAYYQHLYFAGKRNAY
jgi:hypothetical protein